jgi:hypothetical protein
VNVPVPVEKVVQRCGAALSPLAFLLRPTAPACLPSPSPFLRFPRFAVAVCVCAPAFTHALAPAPPQGRARALRGGEDPGHSRDRGDRGGEARPGPCARGEARAPGGPGALHRAEGRRGAPAPHRGEDRASAGIPPPPRRSFVRVSVRRFSVWLLLRSCLWQGSGRERKAGGLPTR